MNSKISSENELKYKKYGIKPKFNTAFLAESQGFEASRLLLCVAFLPVSLELHYDSGVSGHIDSPTCNPTL